MTTQEALHGHLSLSLSLHLRQITHELHQGRESSSREEATQICKRFSEKWKNFASRVGPLTIRPDPPLWPAQMTFFLFSFKLCGAEKQPTNCQFFSKKTTSWRFQRLVPQTHPFNGFSWKNRLVFDKNFTDEMDIWINNFQTLLWYGWFSNKEGVPSGFLKSSSDLICKKLRSPAASNAVRVCESWESRAE